MAVKKDNQGKSLQIDTRFNSGQPLYNFGEDGQIIREENMNNSLEGVADKGISNIYSDIPPTKLIEEKKLGHFKIALEEGIKTDILLDQNYEKIIKTDMEGGEGKIYSVYYPQGNIKIIKQCISKDYVNIKRAEESYYLQKIAYKNFQGWDKFGTISEPISYCIKKGENGKDEKQFFAKILLFMIDNDPKYRPSALTLLILYATKQKITPIERSIYGIFSKKIKQHISDDSHTKYN